MRFLFSIMFFICVSMPLLAWAQINNMNLSDGTVAREKQYVDVKGSPFYIDEWRKGEIVLSNGETYDNVDVKYDMLEDVAIYKGDDGEPYKVTLIVKEFRLLGKERNDTLLFRDARNISNDLKGFYQIIYDGKTKLLRKNIKKIVETPVYGSANVNKQVQDNITFFLVLDGKVVSIKLNKKELVKALSRHASEIENYLKQSKLNFKNDRDLRELFSFYDSL